MGLRFGQSQTFRGAKASPGICECGNRTFTLTMLERDTKGQLFAGCTSCDRKINVSEYGR